MKEKILIVGHVDHSKTTLAYAIKSVLEKEEHGIYQPALDEVIEYKNPYAFLNEKPIASKSRLKKCEKGLHEFSATEYSENNIKRFACIHCGTFMHNR